MVTGFLWRRRWDSNPRGAHHAKTISSRSRYDHFDTSPYMSARRFSPPFSDEKGLWKELTERTANIFNFRTGQNPHGYKVFGGRNEQLPTGFRVRPVMTTSIPLPICSTAVFPRFFFGEKGLWKELTERTANLFNFRTG